MIIFVGSEAKGFFVEEIAEKRKEKFAYVESKSRILQQSYEILSYEGVEHMVFDISQYADSPEELTNEIIKMSKCNNAKIIILAPGYSLKTKILTELYTAGVRNYILGTTLAEMKQQLELSLTDYYEVNGLEELEVVTLQEQKEEERMVESYTLIGVAGAMNRIGTTTQAIQIVKYLTFKGYKACYVELNNTGYVEQLQYFYNVEEHDEDIGKVVYNNIHHYYRQDKISEILKLGYDYYIYDYGVYNHVNFNKTSYLEKDIRIACVGSKPSEMLATQNMVNSNFYSDCFYLFVHAPKGDWNALKESMEDKATFFPAYSPEAYELVLENVKLYEEIIPVENRNEEKKGKFTGLFKRRGKRNGKI
mgnify:CR=1 FL=1|jgi:hypothetical protein